MPRAIRSGEPIEPPILEADGVRLRPYCSRDAAALVGYKNDSGTRAFSPSYPVYTSERAMRFIHEVCAPRSDQIMWAIEVDGEFSGSAELTTYGHGFTYNAARIGYGTAPQLRGRGICTKVISLVTTHAFQLGVETVIWQSFIGNVGSWIPAWRNGFHSFRQVDALLAFSDHAHDGWHAILRQGDPRTPATETPFSGDFSYFVSDAELRGYVQKP